MKVHGDLHQVVIFHKNEEKIDEETYFPILPLTHGKFKVLFEKYINNHLEDNPEYKAFSGVPSIKKRLKDLEIKGFELSNEKLETFICEPTPPAGVNCFGILVIDNDLLKAYTDNSVRTEPPNSLEKQLDLISFFADRREFKHGIMVFGLDDNITDSILISSSEKRKNEIRNSIPILIKTLNLNDLISNYETSALVSLFYTRSILFAVSKFDELKFSV